MNLYEILGVARDATLDQIKKAYRQLAKQHHPDAGGAPEKFHAITQAYDVLGDEARRARYDETGEADEKRDTVDQDALGIIGGLVDELSARIVMNDGLEHVDLVADLRNKVSEQVEKVRADKAEAEKFDRKATALRKRFTARKGPDYIGQMMDANIDKCRRAIAAADERIKRLERAGEILSDAEFKIEPRPAQDAFTALDYMRMRNAYRDAGGPMRGF